ncbi:hypothetical protein ACFPRL_16370 [Pseudoclavibacter helvolus]
MERRDSSRGSIASLRHRRLSNTEHRPPNTPADGSAPLWFHVKHLDCSPIAGPTLATLGCFPS